jgi:glycosyltransferase involved in cell wall biosynthesis
VKTIFLSHGNGGGGAGRATQRLFTSLSDNTDIDLRMHVDFKHGSDPRVFHNTGPGWERRRSLRINLEEIPAYITKHDNPRLFSPGRMSALSADRIDSFKADVLNVHWTNFGYLSIEEMGKITTPFVWTLHDIWAVTGGMNYENDLLSQDCSNYRGIEKWVINRKKNNWKKPFHVVTPSRWLADVVRRSEIGQNWTIHTIPNSLDLEVFAPLDTNHAPANRKTLIVSLGGDLDDSRKGFDLLTTALGSVSTDIDLLVVGHAQPPTNWPSEMPPTQWLGYLGDSELVQAYGRADIAVVPSRQDNLPQTATEPTACGLPVVAFNIGGLPDIVEPGVNGYLATPWEPLDLAHGIDLIASDERTLNNMKLAARQRALALWSPEKIARQYEEAFSAACITAGR